MGLFGKKFDPEPAEECEEQPEHYGMSSSIDRPNYGNPELDYFDGVASSTFLPGIVEMLEETALTEGLKKRLVTVVAELLGNDELRANNNPTTLERKTTNNLKINSLQADILLWSVFASAQTSDLQSIDLIGFLRIIKKDYGALQTRTIGPHRERLIMTELRTTLTSVSSVQQQETKAQVKRQGLLSGMFGGK